MTFSEFLATASLDNQIALDEAKVYTTTTGRMMSPDVMLSYIDGYNLVTQLIDAPTTSQGKTVRAAFNFGSEFNLIRLHPLSVELALDKLVTDNIVPQGFATALINYANPEVTPFKDKTIEDVIEERDLGEVLALNTNSTQHSVRLSISEKPRTHKRIVIEQKFGPSIDNLTEWHEVCSINKVLYTQQIYVSANIPATSAIVRELRAVCESTLGMSIS